MRDIEAAGEPAVSLKTPDAGPAAPPVRAFMAVLKDIQITNASLPYIEGGIGTGGVNGAWVITAYLIGEIIIIPLTDFLSRVFLAAPLSDRQCNPVPAVLGCLWSGATACRR